MKIFAITALFSLTLCLTNAQIITGKVVDKKTDEPLAYVSIGLLNKNIGTISRDDGKFTISLPPLNQTDTLVFSMVGYYSLKVPASELANADGVIGLTPRTVELRAAMITSKEIIELVTLGRDRITKVTLGHSGTDEWGSGTEWGVLVSTGKTKLLLQDIAFHTRFNTVDSVLFRINLYAFHNNFPGNSLLEKPLYVTSRKKDKWIRCDVTAEKLIVSGEMIAAIEIIRIWFSKSGDNQLFFTYGDDTKKLPTYSRAVSHGQWQINAMPPLSLKIIGRKLD